MHWSDWLTNSHHARGPPLALALREKERPSQYASIKNVTPDSLEPQFYGANTIIVST